MESFALSVAGGLVAHLALSRIHEVPTRTFVGTYLSTNVLLFAFLLRTSGSHSSSIKNTLLQNTTFLSTLLVVTALRRLFFHPLCIFPTPSRLAALTKLHEAYIMSHGQLGPRLQLQHRQFGDIIRMGPNEVSINNVSAISALYARGLPYDNRGPFYELSRIAGEHHNVHTMRHTPTHAVWRRIWERGFRPEVLAEYTPRLEEHVDRLVEVVRGLKAEQYDVVKVFSRFAYDVMADMGFGQDFGMQDGTGDSWYMDYIHDFMRFSAIAGSLRNVCELGAYVPKDQLTKNFLKASRTLVTDRQKRGTTRPDVFSYLQKPDEVTGTIMKQGELEANVNLLIIAGSDTTSTVLSGLFFEIARNQEIQNKLYAEISAFAKDAGGLNTQNVKSLKYLQAVVDEGLRLWNPLPSGPQSMIGPEGLTVAGQFVPPYTYARVPHLALLTDERYFPQGDEFIPERWTERPELVKDRRAFIPWSYGQHSCVGKQVAYNQLRLVVAKLVQAFRIEPGESFDEVKYRNQWRDYFIVSLGELPLRFRPRI